MVQINNKHKLHNNQSGAVFRCGVDVDLGAGGRVGPLQLEGDAKGWHRRVPGIFACRSGRGLGVGSGGRGGAVVVWDVEGRVAADAGAPVASRDVSFRSSSTATKVSTTSLSELGSNESPPLPTRPGLA